MIRPTMRSIGTTEQVTLFPDGTFAPGDPSHFGILIDAYVGPEGSDGEERFQFVACSPSWMVNETVTDGAHWLRHYLLLERWSHDHVVSAVTKLCTSINEPDWQHVAQKLGRYMHWEFEDYPE